MPYEVISDIQREEKYPVQLELIEIFDKLAIEEDTSNAQSSDVLADKTSTKDNRHALGVTLEDLEGFDPFEQSLILDAIEELEDVISTSQVRHSATYYRTAFLSSLYGYEDMKDDAQEVACRFAIGLYRLEHPEEEKEDSQSNKTSNKTTRNSQNNQNKKNNKKAHNTPKVKNISSGNTATYHTRKLVVLGHKNRGICFTAFEDNEAAIFTFSAQTFGIGEEIELFSIPMNELVDDGLSEVLFSEASFEWENNLNMGDAFPVWKEDENDFYQESENAFSYVLKEMYDFKQCMEGEIYQVVGYENMDSIKHDEEMESIFESLQHAYGIKLTDEQKKQFENGETIEVDTPLGRVSIDSKKTLEEIKKRKEEHENR